MTRKTVITTVCALALALAPASSVQAGPLIDWSVSDTQCASFSGFGLATDAPRVRAYNTTRYRDRQKVALQLSFDQYIQGSGWRELGRTEWYYAYAWDNLYAQAWQSTAGRGTQLAWQKWQWQLTAPGVYRSYIRVWHYATRYIGSRSTGWRIPVHNPGYDDNGNGIPDYCVIVSI
jgi:hypothetical protein